MWQVLYVGIVLHNRRDPARSQTGVSVAGVVLVSITVAAGLGFCALVGIAFNATTTQIIPFLALGLGVDNMLNLLHTYADTKCDGNLEVSLICVTLFAGLICFSFFQEQNGVVLKKSGGSVIVTSSCMALSFLAAALIPIPALRGFAITAAILVMFNLLATLLVFPAIVSLDLRRRKARMWDVLCCRDAPPPRPTGWSLRRFAAKHYVPFLLRKGTCAAVIVLHVIVLGSALWGSLRVKDGLELKEVVPQYTGEHAFLEAQSDLFGFYNMYAVTRGEFEYPINQRLLYDYHEAFMRVPNVMKNDNGGLQTFWLAMFRDWLMNLQVAFDRDWKNGAITQERWFSNASDEGILAYKLLVQTGHVDNPVDKSLVWKVRLVDTHGIINPKAFYNYLSAWSWNDALAYGFSQANLRPEPRQWLHVANDYELKIPKSGPLVYSQLPFYLQGLRDTTEITELIAQVRAICARFEERGLPNFPSGIPFLFWEQYLALRSGLALALVCALAAIFILSSALLLNVWAAFLVVLSMGSVVLQLLGLMGAVGMQLSAVPAVLLVVAVGIATHFTLHISLVSRTFYCRLPNEREASNGVYLPLVYSICIGHSLPIMEHCRGRAL